MESSIEQRISQVVAEISKKRSAKVEETDSGEVHLIVEDILVFAAKPLEHSIKVAMLPDVFTYSTFPNDYRVGQLHFDGKGYLAIYFDVEECDLADVFEVVKDAVIDLNLYGYQVTT